MNYFQDLSQTELKQKKGKVLKAAWIISLGAPVGTGIAYLLGRTNILLADFFRRTAELLALFLAWVVFCKVEKGSNREYNYGYHKLEDLSSLFVGFIMIISFIIVLDNSVNRLIEPEPSGWLIPGLIIASLGVLVNGWFWQHNYRLNKRETTPVFETQWRLYRVKTLIDFFVIITLILDISLSNNLWSIYIDFIGSLVVASILLVSGFYLMKNAVNNLADRAPLPVEKIRSAIDPLLLTGMEIGNIRCRQAGGCLFIDVLVAVVQEKQVEEVEKVKEKIIRKIKDMFPLSDIQIILNWR